MNKIRINSIEIRKTPPASHHSYEVIKWFPNSYYQKEKEYKENGYVDSPTGGFLSKNNVNIDKNFFTHSELCYVIMFMNDKGVLEGVGTRLADLDDQESMDFFNVYRMAVKMMGVEE